MLSVHPSIHLSTNIQQSIHFHVRQCHYRLYKMILSYLCFIDKGMHGASVDATLVTKTAKLCNMAAVRIQLVITWEASWCRFSVIQDIEVPNCLNNRWLDFFSWFLLLKNVFCSPKCFLSSHGEKMIRPTHLTISIN